MGCVSAAVAQSGEADLPPRHLTRSRVEVPGGVIVLVGDRVGVVGAGGPCECVARAQRSARGRRAAAHAAPGAVLSCAAVAARVHRPARVHRQPIAPRRDRRAGTVTECCVVDGLRGAESSAGGERLHTAYSTVQYAVQYSTKYSTPTSGYTVQRHGAAVATNAQEVERTWKTGLLPSVPP